MSSLELKRQHVREAVKRWKDRHPDAVKEYNRTYQLKPENKERKRKRDATRRKKDPEFFLTVSRQWRAANPGKSGESRRKSNRKLKAEMFAAYGSKCKCCGETREQFLTLDHIGGGGNEHRRRLGHSRGSWVELRRLGWPQDKYRLLCMNCNWVRRLGAACPHEADLSVDGEYF